MNKLEKLAEAIGILQELLRYETNEEDSHIFYEAHNNLVKVLTKEKEQQDFRVFTIDYKNSKFIGTVKAKNVEEAYAKACELYPRVKNYLQVYELGESQYGKKNHS